MKRSVDLYKCEGSADKVYQAEMLEVGDLWRVVFRNARRGQALKVAKQIEGLGLSQANEAFDKQVASKKKDGYTENQDGAAYTSSEFEGRVSGARPQLPRPLQPDDLEHKLRSDEWLMQEKMNGENRPILIGDGIVRGASKKGLWVDIPVQWTQEFAVLGDAEIAGEHVGETLHAFDLLSLGGQDFRHYPYELRYELLAKLLAEPGSLMPSMRLVRAFFTEADKRAELIRLEENGLEGAVFKLRSAPFEAGASDAAYKHKFLESSACLVMAHNGLKRSVKIGLLGAGAEAGQTIPVGNVTIPGSVELPPVGSLIEVEYLYFNPGGAFEQPVYLRRRTDMEPNEALISQVQRFKPEVVAQRREREGAGA